MEGGGARTAREASRHGVDGHRHRRGGDPGDAPAARLRRTALRGGASARAPPPAATCPRFPHTSPTRGGRPVSAPLVGGALRGPPSPPRHAAKPTDPRTHPPTSLPAARKIRPSRHQGTPAKTYRGIRGCLWLPPCGSMVLVWLCWSISDGRPALASSRRSSACRIGGDCRHGRHDDVGVLQLTPRGCMSCRAALLFLYYRRAKLQPQGPAKDAARPC